MGTDLDRLAAIFGAARRLAPPERPAFLAQACGGDGALRAEVEGLLEAHAAAGGADALPPSLASLPSLATAVLEEAQAGAGPLPSAEGFRVLRRLAEGGMGTVYVAEQERPRRRVALKVLRPEAATPEGRRRFEREAEVLARLEHPGIARVLVHGTTTGPGAPRPFLAMELVEGRRLTEATAPWDLRARVAVLAQVAEAVAHAHAKGVIHRDLKPDNILVQTDGRPRVVDFGVARVLDAEGTLATRAGDVIGTLLYMSPEQARGDVDAVDTRSDVYSLGVVAYEVLCRRHPLGDRRGTFTEIVRRIQEERPQDAGAVEPALQGDLSLILAKAMAKEPSERYVGAGGLAEDLRRHLADEPILARPLTGTYQLRRFLRRHKGLVAASAAGLMALVAGLVLALGLAHAERSQRRRADRTALDLERALAERSIELAASALREHDAAGVERALAQVPEGRRGWEWRYLHEAADGSTAWEPLDAGPLRAARLAEGGGWLAITARGEVHVRPAPGEAPRRIGLPPMAVPRAPLTVGGRAAALDQRGAAIRVLDATGATIFETSLPSRRKVQAVAASPDERLVAVAQDGNRSWCALCLLDARSGETVRKTVGALIHTSALAFSGDGSLLAVGSGWDGSVRFVATDPDREVPPPLTGHTGGVTEVAFSPDGTILATVAQDRTARLWDLASGRELRRLVGHAGAPVALAFAPDGGRLVTGAEDGTIRVWDVASGASVRLLCGHRGPVRALRVDEDRTTLVSLGDDGLRRWRLDTDPDVLRVHRGPEEGNRTPYVYGVAFSPDGSLLASSGWDDSVRIVNVASRRLVRTFETEGEPVFDVQWSRDGRSVVGGRGRLVRWEVATGAEVTAVEVPAGVSGLAALADGVHVLAGDARGGVELRSVADLASVASWRIGQDPVEDLAAAPGDAAFATITEKGSVEVRSLPDGVRLWGRKAHPSAAHGAVAFSPDGAWLASGGGDDRVRIWDARTGDEVRALDAHPDAVYALAWLPDGARLFSGDNRGLIRVWDPRTGHLLLELRGHTSYVYRLDVSPDGTTIASASGDNTVRLWSTRPAAEGGDGAPGGR